MQNGNNAHQKSLMFTHSFNVFSYLHSSFTSTKLASFKLIYIDIFCSIGADN